ncbi:MAG: type II toxin-antitoxin system HicB family antitoxin [Acidobacteria bacterium]|nr:type II toxin-antitoxin system HicB family antitoxin [Acidobacteriota bacterium]
MKKYAVLIEQGENNCSAYVPDLPGCVAAGDTVEETERLIREAIEIHIRGMREDGLEVPPPSSLAREIEVAAWMPSGMISSRAPLADLIAAAVRRSLNTPRLRVDVRRIASASFKGWRVRLLERRRTSDPIDLYTTAIAVIKKIGLIPPERHGDLRIALAGIREDWSG